MTETRCRWVDGEYVQADGEPCDTPKKDHCTARRTCPNHLPWGQQTCARCLGRTRQDIRRITDYAPLLDAAALESRSINSEATNLAGPACDVEAWSWRKVTSRQGRSWHWSEEEDDNEVHPFTVLTYWAWQIVGVYSLPEPDVYTIGNAAAMLDTQLHRIANDQDQDFRGMAAEIKRCREHLDAALAIRQHVERGVPCYKCAEDGKFARLVREYADGRPNDADDLWVCPRDRSHYWNHAAYTKWLEDRKIAG